MVGLDDIVDFLPTEMKSLFLKPMPFEFVYGVVPYLSLNKTDLKSLGKDNNSKADVARTEEEQRSDDVMLGDWVSDISSDNEEGDQMYDDIHDDGGVADEYIVEEKEPEKEEENAAREPYSEYDNVDADLGDVVDEDIFLVFGRRLRERKFRFQIRTTEG
jgi:hypothetical protein